MEKGLTRIQGEAPRAAAGVAQEDGVVEGFEDRYSKSEKLKCPQRVRTAAPKSPHSPEFAFRLAFGLRTFKVR